jgi:hypothetical protein
VSECEGAWRGRVGKMVAREEGERVIAKAGGYGSAADRTCVPVSVIFLTFALISLKWLIRFG